METLTNNPESEKEKLIEEIFNRPTVIGLEGGPCSGKTTFAESLKFSNSKDPIVVLPEAATQIIEKYTGRGINIVELVKNNPEMLIKFEIEVLSLTIGQIEQAKNEFYGTGATIVADRVDVGGYLNQEDHNKVLQKLNLDKPPMLDLVDKVLYFPTLAKKDETEYMRQRYFNPCRTESPKEAIERCDSTLKATSAHPEFHYMDLGDFNSTLNAATSYVMNPDNEFEKGGYLIGDFGEAERMIFKKEQAGMLLGISEIDQQYVEHKNLAYRLREEIIIGTNSSRLSISIKERAAQKETQRSISQNEFNLLSSSNKKEIYKTRYRFLHQDETSGIFDVWSLDHIKTKHGTLGWVYEVEKHDQESLAEIKPPFNLYVEKKYSNEDLAKLALMFS